MPSLQPGPGQARYLIRAVGDAVPLAAFIAGIGADPSIRIVERIGPPGQPHTLVAEMSADRASELEQSFRQSQQLMIEPDRPLSMYQ